MTTQTFEKLEKQTERIVESLSASAKVDPENGIVRNVKLIGFMSKNGRVYPPQVLRSAVHLYEGAKVNIDHPAGGDPSKARSYQDRFGVIRNVRFVEGSGLHADFHFNPKHPAAEQFTWDAERNPEAVGFSHNALLRIGQAKNGRAVVEEIVSIRSMDLVADPATTTSLFESENPMEMTANHPTPQGIDTPAQEKPNPQEQIKNALKQMVLAAIDDEKLDMKATIKKIQEIMRAQEKLMGGMSGGTESDGQEHVNITAVGAADTSLKQQILLLKQQLEQYQEKERLAQLKESIDQALVEAGLDPNNPVHVSDVFAKQLMATESEQSRQEMIADRVAIVGASGGIDTTRSHSVPTYRPPQSMTEQIDAKSFASRLLS